jgi:hypothetical protein
MIIDIKEELAKRNMPRPLKVLNDLPSEDADNIVRFILEMVIADVRCGLGLMYCDEDHPLHFFNEIHQVYKEYYGGCFFCDSEIHELDEKSEICIICHKKLVDFLELRSQQIEAGMI